MDDWNDNELIYKREYFINNYYKKRYFTLYVQKYFEFSIFIVLYLVKHMICTPFKTVIGQKC